MPLFIKSGSYVEKYTANFFPTIKLFKYFLCDKKYVVFCLSTISETRLLFNNDMMLS